MTLLDLLHSRGLQPRRISVNHGGEYACSCPVCGDGGKGARSDRFHVWPQRETSGLSAGRFWCRQCGISGDTIGFLQKIDGRSFPDACAELGIPLERGRVRRSRYTLPPAVKPVAAGWQPVEYPPPSATWQHKAANLLADCQQRLAGDQEAMAWLAVRGITAEMAAAYGLGFNRSSKGGDRYRPRTLWGLTEKLKDGRPKKLWIPQGWVIPSRGDQGQLLQLRIRRRNQDVERFGGHIKYLPVDGSSQATMVLRPAAPVQVVVESGFDAILLDALGGGLIGGITTWNSSARPDCRAHALLEGCECILGGLDYDQGGDEQQEWWKATYRHYRRLPALHGGAKDPGQAIEDGHLDHAGLRRWLLSGLPRGLRTKHGLEETPAAVQVEPAPAVDQQPPSEPAQVAELTLKGGKVVYVTDDQDQWRELMDDGLPAFSANELERLQAGAGQLGEEEVEVVVAIKELFGGYIRAGRGCHD